MAKKHKLNLFGHLTAAEIFNFLFRAKTYEESIIAKNLSIALNSVEEAYIARTVVAPHPILSVTNEKDQLYKIHYKLRELDLYLQQLHVHLQGLKQEAMKVFGKYRQLLKLLDTHSVDTILKKNQRVVRKFIK